MIMVHMIGNRNLEIMKYFLWSTTVCSLLCFHALSTYNNFNTCCKNKLVSPRFMDIKSMYFGGPNEKNGEGAFLNRRMLSINETYKILWYNSPSYFLKKAHISLRACRFNNCQLTTDLGQMSVADAVIFRHNYLPNILPVKHTDQIWILHGQETPFYMRKNYLKKAWLGQFNWSITYGHTSDISMPYASIAKEVIRAKKNYSDIYRKKTKQVAWIVSHCFAVSGRDEYVRELRKYISVDIYGKCGNLTCSRDGNECMDNISKEYKFYLSFENSLCKDYVSEKVFALYNNKYSIIPIIRGAPNIDEYVPRKTYINAFDFENPEILANYLLRLGSDEQTYSSYLQEKDKFRPYYASYYRAMCSLCEKLNKYNKSKVLENSSWFTIRNNCLVPQNRSQIVIKDRAPDYWYWD
ncbi:glycoprotein 3-alpha-L-fucosyltransferase A-like [Mytilus trossulus]|uniref:glycoprotein 3-alpha-L-fucosyltransferase A-like n=1 Tax=Mytilus trossulus TaxID=6551 RepID=UPI003005DCD9